MLNEKPNFNFKKCNAMLVDQQTRKFCGGRLHQAQLVHQGVKTSEIHHRPSLEVISHLMLSSYGIIACLFQVLTFIIVSHQISRNINKMNYLDK